MRLFIPFLCLIVFAACHNKSDLKRIAELKKENYRLSKLLKEQYQFQTDAEYKLLYGQYEFPICDLSIPGALPMHYLRNEQIPKLIIVNQSFINQIKFYEDLTWKIDTIKYSIPSKDKSSLKKFTHKIVNNSDRYTYQFDFIPKDTGCYYFDGVIIFVDDVSKETTRQYFIDSFYVCK